MTYSRSTVLAAAFCSALTMLAPSAIAGPVFVTGERQELLYRHIKYADLDLASAEDQAQFHTRVGSAIRGLCLEATSFERSARSGIYVMQCRQSAWTQAKPQIANAIGSAHRMAALGYPAAAAAVVISIGVPAR